MTWPEKLTSLAQDVFVGGAEENVSFAKSLAKEMKICRARKFHVHTFAKACVNTRAYKRVLARARKYTRRIHMRASMHTEVTRRLAGTHMHYV